jgi:hypothetical protein
MRKEERDFAGETTTQTLVTIFLVASGEAKWEDGQWSLTEKSLNAIKINFKRRFKISSGICPDFCYIAPRASNFLTLAELARLYRGELHGFQTEIRQELDNPYADKKSWARKIFRQIKEEYGINFWDLGWKKRVRNDDWTDTGYETMNAFRDGAENCLHDLACQLTKVPASHVPVGLILADGMVFNPVRCHDNMIPPLKPGDIIKYSLIVVGGKKPKTALINQVESEEKPEVHLTEPAKYWPA